MRQKRHRIPKSKRINQLNTNVNHIRHPDTQTYTHIQTRFTYTKTSHSHENQIGASKFLTMNKFKKKKTSSKMQDKIQIKIKIKLKPKLVKHLRWRLFNCSMPIRINSSIEFCNWQKSVINLQYLNE